MVVGADTERGHAVVALLVGLGAEVHALTTTDVRLAITGIASSQPTGTDLGRVARRIGAVVNAVVDCGDPPAPPDAVVEAFAPLMTTGGAVLVAAAAGDHPASTEAAVTQATARHRAGGVRVNAVVAPPEVGAEAFAWTAVWLGGVRSVAVNGATVRLSSPPEPPAPPTGL